MKNNFRYMILMVLMMHNCIDASGIIAPKSVKAAKVTKSSSSSVRQNSTKKLNDFGNLAENDRVTGEQIGSFDLTKIPSSKSNKTAVQKEVIVDLMLTPEDVPMPNNKLAKAKIESNKSYDKAKAKIDAVVEEQIQDTQLVEAIEKSPEYKKFKSTMAQKIAYNASEGMNFLSSIQWSKLSPVKNIAKTASSSARQVNHFFKDLSIAVKKTMPNTQLSKQEQQFQLREQAVQIGRMSKKIDQSQAIMKENQDALKTVQEQLKTEQAKELQDPFWVKKHQDDIAYLQEQIAGRNKIIADVTAQRKKLMGDTFNQDGHLLYLEQKSVPAQ